MMPVHVYIAAHLSIILDMWMCAFVAIFKPIGQISLRGGSRRCFFPAAIGDNNRLASVCLLVHKAVHTFGIFIHLMLTLVTSNASATYLLALGWTRTNQLGH